jgi:alpha-mannosidase
MEFMDGNLVFSALKPAEDGDGMILRVWNPNAEAASERINIWKAPTCVFKTNLGEMEKGEAVAVNGTQIDVTAQPWQIVTLRIRM